MKNRMKNRAISAILALMLAGLFALGSIGCDDGTMPKKIDNEGTTPTPPDNGGEPGGNTPGVLYSYQGEASSAPENPQLNWIYYNTADKTAYIYDGSAWKVLVRDGQPGGVGQVTASIDGDGNLVINGTIIGKVSGGSGTLVEIRDGIDGDGYPNQTWWLDGEDTHMPVKGKDGNVGTLDSVLTIGSNGNWFIDGEDTGRPARGAAGQIGANGTNGTQITISGSNTWVLDGVDTHISLSGPAGPAGPTGPAGANGTNGTNGSVLTIENGNWYIDGADTGVSATSGGGGGEPPEPPPPPHDHAYAWRFVMPMPNIASLLEEDACTICDDVRGKRKSYSNLSHWLLAQDGGTSAANPVTVPAAIALGATNADSGGWGDLLFEIGEAGKYVALDLTDCTLPTSVTAFNGSTFATAGKAFVVSITFPRTAVPTGTSTVSVNNGFTNLKSVTGYGDVRDYAFYNAAANNTLKEASFPSAASIGVYAFSNCIGLTEASFPSATTINVNAFSGCTGLTEVSFPSVTNIFPSAFAGCTGLTEVSFPETIYIQSGAFAGCTGLTSVSFPDATTIGSNDTVAGAFDGCTNLVKAYFLNVTTITTSNNTSGHFNGCTSLAEVYFAKATAIPASTTAALSMFNGCTALAQLYIPLVRDIGNNALTSANSLTKITIARNCTISATGQSTRVTAFKTYYDGIADKKMGTYTWNGTAWEYETAIPTVTVTFNANGGAWGGDTTRTVTVVTGLTVSQTEAPVREWAATAEGLYSGTGDRYVLTGWRRQGDSVNWNFSTPITANTTLVAQWDAPVSVNISAATGDNNYLKAVNYINSNAGQYTLFINANISTAGATLSSGGTLTLRGIGQTRTISLSATGALLTINNSGAKVILGSNITLQGRAGNNNSVVRVTNGELVMREGAAITGNTNSSQGGGVYIQTNGTFVMEGGTISGNTSTYYGGGVHNEGTFTMNGGTISGNTSSNGGGGGVQNNSGGTFRIVNGTIYGSNEADTSLRNTAPSGGAAALYVGGGTAQRGTFVNGAWVSKGTLSTSNNTIRVVEGESQ